MSLIFKPVVSTSMGVGFLLMLSCQSPPTFETVSATFPTSESALKPLTTLKKSPSTGQVSFNGKTLSLHLKLPPPILESKNWICVTPTLSWLP